MIYTFYSYKGGVGRSMALANIAECFYAKGLRVLIVDWDLEAPGLESFFFEMDETGPHTSPPAEAAAIRSRLGLIDMLVSYKQMYPRLPLVPPQNVDAAPKQGAPSPDTTTASPLDIGKVLDEHLPPLADFVTPIHRSASGGELWLLSAGWRQDRFAEYARAVQAFEWDGFYTGFAGQAYFEWMRRQFAQHADVVMIDSRTGVTEMGGVCARQLADVVVSFCAPNYQNIDGIAKMVRSFHSSDVLKARNGRAIETIVIPTRIDDSELDRLGRFKELFHAQIEKQSGFVPSIMDGVDRPFWELQVPYIPKFAYLESRVVGLDIKDQDPSGKLPKAYWRLATQLAALSPPNNPARRCFAEEIARELPKLHSGIFISYVGGQGNDIAVRLADILRDSGIDTAAAEATPGATFGNAETAAVIITEAAANSDALRRQVRAARSLGRCVYAVTSADVAITSRPKWLTYLPVIELADPKQLVEKLGARCQADRIPMMAPPLSEDAVPRDTILTALKATIGKTETVALVGPAGTGKSLVAAQFCHDDDVIDAFPGGIIWLASEPSGAPDAMQRTLYEALFGRDDQYSEATGAGRIGQRLHDSRHLIVIDDAQDNKTTKDIVVLNETGLCLLVTRNADVASAFAASIIPVGPLTEAEGIALMSRAFTLPGQRFDQHLTNEMREIVNELGAWPAAVHLGSLALRDEIEKLKKDATARPDLTEEAIAGINASIDTHGVLAFDQVARARQRAPLAAVLGSALAMLSPSEREYLARLAEQDGDVTLAEAMELWGLNRRQTRNLLKRFETLSLLSLDREKPDQDDGDQTIRIHRPIALYLMPQRTRTSRRQISSSADRQSNPDVLTATSILGGTTVPDDGALRNLVRALKAARYFDLARQIAALARQQPEIRADSAQKIWFAQQEALCTYKDPDLPADQRLDDAFAILSGDPQLASTTAQETLGLAGALFKRKWEISGQRSSLERSLAYYRRGYQQGVLQDDGYTAINCAFLLDLLANQEEQDVAGLAGASTDASARREEARRIREEIARKLADKFEGQRRAGRIENAWFLLVTLGEANFGLGRYDEALHWLREGQKNPQADWEYETTARQLAELARLQSKLRQSGQADEAWNALRQFLGDDAVAATSVGLGKMGLSLSGGGFRASLFHIGVLARLAERDVLRHVEVLSCVSGGSIIGAYYYLELRNLLQSKADHEITRDDYVSLVSRIVDRFLLGIQRNIRCRLTSEFIANLKMAFVPNYSTSLRLGELFESEIFSLVDDGEGNRPRWLDQLVIQPKGEGSEFAPKLDNWRRSAKVPVLILNATTLNTGHNWQFTASWMGETPTSITSEIDANDRLRRLYYWQAPKSYQRFRLGHAVAASACVPGLFEPLALPDLYPDRIVHLVDGGLHDNQGVASLIEQDCAIFLVSDATGQMQTIQRPRSELLDLPMRANSILMARVREAEFRELDARRKSSLIRGLMFVHLKRGLDVVPVDWVGAQQPYLRAGAATVSGAASTTSYGIDKDAQNSIAAIRTDLDSFNDAEAFALMTSGYLMTREGLPQALPSAAGLPADQQAAVDWRFLDVQDYLKDPKGQDQAGQGFMDLLDAGSAKMFKAFRLAPVPASVLFAGPLIASIGVILGALLLVEPLRSGLALLAASSLWRAAALVGAASIVWLAFLFFTRRKSITQFFFGLLFAIFGPIGRYHLLTTDPLYLRLGRVQPTRLSKMLKLAAEYDRIRKELPSGPVRTRQMSAIFEAMTEQASSVQRSLPTLQSGKSPGQRLCAIAILQGHPDADHLAWLAERLDPQAEKPFVGYAAATALLQSVRSLPTSDGQKLKMAIDRARLLAERNPDDQPRLAVLNTAQRELMRKLSAG